MPTHDQTESFRREFAALTPPQVAQFAVSLKKFIVDLTAIEEGARTEFRRGLRVKRYMRDARVMEMTWAGDGRALFKYGDQIVPGKRHVEWLRVGTHDIF